MNKTEGAGDARVLVLRMPSTQICNKIKYTNKFKGQFRKDNATKIKQSEIG